MRRPIYKVGDEVTVVKEAGMLGFLVAGKLMQEPPSHNTLVHLLPKENYTHGSLRTFCQVRVPPGKGRPEMSYALYGWCNSLYELEMNQKFEIAALPA